jgi:hypothetical protein
MYDTYMDTLRTDTYVRYTFPCERERCVIFDLDDTLARYCKTRRLTKCHEFEPMQEQLALAHEAQGSGIAVVIASARPEWAGQGTFKWLQTHGLKPSAVYLRNRQHLTYRPEELKEGMLRDILARYQVESFHDDAPDTIRMARALGVNAFWVKGNEEYWASKGQVPLGLQTLEAN